MDKFYVHILLKEGKGFKFNSASVSFGISTKPRGGAIITIDDKQSFELNKVEKLEMALVR